MKNPASGAASRACWKATPDEIMQRSLVLPSIARFGPLSSLNFCMSASFARSRACAGFAWPGTMTRAGMSRTNSAFGSSGAVSGNSTIVLLWAMRVVVRNTNGMPHLREYSNASFVKSYASCESAGSRTGSPPMNASERVSCSFWLEAMPGSSATTATIPPCMPLYEAVKKRSWGDVKANVLHRHEGVRSCERRAERDFRRDFFVRSPLGVSADEREVFENFRGRGSGVSDAERASGVERPEGYRLVAA